MHLQATFFCSRPIYIFLIGQQVDIVPKGCADAHPIAHQLYSRLLELEAQLEVYVADVQSYKLCQSYCNIMI